MAEMTDTLIWRQGTLEEIYVFRNTNSRKLSPQWIGIGRPWRSEECKKQDVNDIVQAKKDLKVALHSQRTTYI